MVTSLAAACAVPSAMPDGTSADVVAGDARDSGAMDVPTEVAVADTASEVTRDVTAEGPTDATSTAMCGPT